MARIMASKSKSKATAFSPGTKALNANLTNSMFGYLPSAEWKGKLPANSSKSVRVQPDLDLLSGFAFLSFASLEELETHIEHNEATSAAISVNVGQKRKAETSSKRQGESSGLPVPPSKKKAAPIPNNRRPKQLMNTLTTGAAAKSSLSDGPPKHKTNQVSSVGTILDEPDFSQPAPIDISASRGEINEQSSSNIFSEISLLCSETVDLGDDEDLPQEVYKELATTVSDTSERGVGSGQPEGTTAEIINQNEGVVEGISTNTDPIPKKKKKKKRKKENCDQTSQTKFRIKKKAKSDSKSQASERKSNSKSGEMKNDTFPDQSSQEVDSGDVKNLLSRPKMERVSCARTMFHKEYFKGKSKFNASEASSGDQLIGLTPDSSSESAQAKPEDKITLDGSNLCKDQENEIGDELASASVVSDLSDHSSDLETFTDRCGCFLLNNKIEKVEKEDVEAGEEVVDVDVESVGKETRKNFLVVSGIEAGHFSYHPELTKDGTIDTSIQALPNEIDIFLQCAKMQEGEMIKIINPDDTEELNSHFTQNTQNNGRNPAAVKAVRSATERKRRHHLGDLLNDLKLEVYTDLVEVDLYFSKQAILSKGISAIEELHKESKELSNAKKQLMKKNKALKEKRNLLMFGKEVVDVTPAKVDTMFRQLNIELDDQETVKAEENSNSSQDTATDAASESQVAFEPCVKGRPKKKTLLSPWVSNNKPVPKNKDDLSTTAANLPSKATTQTPNVSCGVQTLEDGKDSSKSTPAENLPVSQNLPAEDSAAKSKPNNESASQEDVKPNLVKILPKPAILHLNPTQQKVMIMDTLGQVKQPSSDKIICNLSRLSTMQNPSSSSSICFIRGGQLMTSLDSKNVTHIKINNDDPKNAFSASCSTSTVTTLSQQITSTTAATNKPGLLTLGVTQTPKAPGIPSVHASQKHLEKPVLVSQMPLKSTTAQVSSMATTANMPGLLTFNAPGASGITNVPATQKHPERPLLVSQIAPKPSTTQVLGMPTVTNIPGLLTFTVPKTSPVPGPLPTSQQHPGNVLLVPQIPPKSATTQVLSATTATSVPGFVPQGVTKTFQAPVTASVPTSQKHPENTLPVSQIPLKSATTQVLTTTTTTSVPGFVTLNVAKIPQAPGSSSVPTSQIPLKSATTQVLTTTTTTSSVPGFVTLGVSKTPQAPGPSSVPASQKHPGKTPLLISPIAQKSPTTQVSSTTTATTNVPGFVTLGVAKTPQAPGPSGVPDSQKRPGNTPLLISPITLKSPNAQVSSTTTAVNKPGFLTFSVAKMPVRPAGAHYSYIPLKSTSTPTVIFAGKPLSMLATSTASPQSSSQPSSEMTMRALASLSQLQGNRPPVVGTAAKPAVLNENPVAGILSGLKNVVMKVVPSPGKPVVQSTRSGAPTVPAVTMVTKTTAVKGVLSSQTPVASSQGKHPAATRTINVIPIISIPSSSPLNSSITASAVNKPLSSPGVSAKDDSAPFIKPCLDPFNLVPKEPAAPSPTIRLEPDPEPSADPPTSLDLEPEIKEELEDNLTSSESPSPIPDDIFNDEPLKSSTVLTQEMLNIPGIEQRPDVPLAKLPEVLENLADLDKTSDTESPEPSCDAEGKKPDGPDTGNVSSSSSASEVQTSVPSLSLQSSAVGTKKSTSPLRVEIKDFRKGTPPGKNLFTIKEDSTLKEKDKN